METQDPVILLTENKREKVFGNLLTNPKIYDTIITKDKGKENPNKPERKFTMKKATLQAIYDTLSMQEMEGMVSPDVLAELKAELNKGAEEKAARAAAYAGIHDVVVDNLTETPVSLNDLWPEIESEVTAKDMTKHNVQYALNNLWQDEIVKIVGKPNTYKRR